MRLSKDSPLREQIPLISVDIDYQKSIPIEDVASRLGMSFNRSKSCYCPDPNCPDNSSKNRGAHINTKNNTIHCFVCGGTWNAFTLAGLKQFGYDNNQCFTRDGIVTIGKFIAEDLGFGGIKKLTPSKGDDRYPKMPEVAFICNGMTGFKRDKPLKLPLWKAVGLSRNPFLSTTVSVSKENGGIDIAENMSISAADAALMISMKCMEQLRAIHDFINQPFDVIGDISAPFLYDLQNECNVITDYTKKLYPLLDNEGKKTLTSELLYQFVMTDIDSYRKALVAAYPQSMQPITESLAALYDRGDLLYGQNEAMKGGEDDYDMER